MLLARVLHLVLSLLNGRSKRIYFMKKIAFIFPGQGSQYAGMGKDFYNSYSSAREVFDKADEILGFSLSEICFNGPEEKLTSTDICQPAILTCSIAAAKTIEAELRIKPVMCGGLSLGEYSALVCAGALRFEDAVSLVYKRGSLMREACEKNEGTMASLLGSDEKTAREIVEKVSGETGEIGVANINSPGQVVISGSRPAVLKAIGIAKEAGIKRAIEIKVAGAYHSSLMREAEEKLVGELNKVELASPVMKITCNVSGSFYNEKSDIRALLATQVTSPVLWQKCVESMIEDGIDLFVEPGCGKVLTGLLKRIDSGKKCCVVENNKSLETLKSLVQ